MAAALAPPRATLASIPVAAAPRRRVPAQAARAIVTETARPAHDQPPRRRVLRAHLRRAQRASHDRAPRARIERTLHEPSVRVLEASVPRTASATALRVVGSARRP